MSDLRLARTRAELADLLTPRRATGERVGFVPTMGALHEGHASLMRVAAEQVSGGPVVASVFVNPLQFSPGEDLDRYPRTLEADLKLCEREGVDVVFAPTVEAVYPGGVEAGSIGDAITVDPGPLATILEGRTRPTHFRGVVTVVAKLFGLVRPDVAVFGQKDYQQLVLLQRMAADLCLGVEVIGAETQRESDGLALSSRNAYLDDEQRRNAVALHRTLLAAREAAPYGVTAALDAARTELRSAVGVDLDYLELTTPGLGVLPDDVPAGTPARALIAARLGRTRLIDNLPLVIGAVMPGSPTPTTNDHQAVRPTDQQGDR